MLIRAIAAFAALPGMLAFALPIAIGISTSLPVLHVELAAPPLGVVRAMGLARSARWQAYQARVPRWVI